MHATQMSPSRTQALIIIAADARTGVRKNRSSNEHGAARCSIAAIATLPRAAAPAPPTSARSRVRATGTARPRQRRKPATELADTPIEYEADGVEATRDGEMLLTGRCADHAGRAHAEDAQRHVQQRRTQSFSVDEGVEYADPNLKVSGSSAQRRSGRRRRRSKARSSSSRIATRAAPRTASRSTRDSQLKLDGVRYTTCPLGNEDWVLRATDIDISQRAGTRHRPRRAAGLQGRADPVHAVHLLSGRQPAQVRLPVSDHRHLLAQRLRRCRCRGTGTSRRTTTRRSCRLGSPSAAASSTPSSAT